MKAKVVVFILAIGFLIALFCYQLARSSDNQLHIVFCDVGQGDAIFIRTPKDIDILIDGGRDSRVLDCLSSHMPFWDRGIDIVFASHPDSDHITGLVDVLERYRVGQFVTVEAAKTTGIFEELNKTVAEEGLRPFHIEQGDTFSLTDGIKIQTLWPTQSFEDTKNEDTNTHSLVQLLTYGEFSLLLTGDVDFEYLNPLMPNLKDIDVFKLPHHGSKTGIDGSTFTSIQPDLSIISAGRNNRYGHPHKEVLDIMKRFDIDYESTFEGDIEIVTDGKEIKLLD